MAVKITNDGVFIDEELIAGGDGVWVPSFVNVDSDIEAEINRCYLCDVSETGFTITLPDNPKDNDFIQVVNYKGSFKDNNLTINGNGNKINGSDEDYVCNLDDSSYTLQYSEDNEEWVCLIASSFNLGSLFAEFMCEIPELSNPSADEVNERDYIEVDIDNYDENTEYLWDSEYIVKIVYRSDKTFKVYFGSVDEDTDIEFRFRAIKIGYISSNWSNAISVTVKDRPEEEDDSIINDAFADNEDSSSDADVTNDKVTFTADGGVYKEVITQQGEDETDWSSYQTIARTALDKMSIIDEDTDTDTLAVKDENIKNVSKCYIVNDDYPNGVEIDIGDVTEEDIDITDTLDVFNDDSAIELWEFEESSESKSGENDGTENGDVLYNDDGKYGKCYEIQKGEADTYIELPEIDGIKTISLWCNLIESNGYSGILSTDGNNYIFLDDVGWLAQQDDDDNNYSFKNDNKISELVDKNTWFHLVFVLDGTEKGKMYLNNEEYENTSSSDLSGVDSFYYMYQHIGYTTNSDHTPNALIDQLRFFNKALTADEVNKLYDEQYTKYKADISSNELDNAPTSAYFIEENVTISTALTKDSDPIDPDDFNDETLDTWSIDTDNDYKENTYQKVSDYSGNEFQRKITGDKNANIIYLESKMWKDS